MEEKETVEQEDMFNPNENIGKEIIIRDELELGNTDFYQSLLEDCRSIMVERGFRARIEVIEAKWDIGKRIYEDNEQMSRQKIYGERIIESLSRDLHISSSSLFSCVQFFKKYPFKEFEQVVPGLPGGKEISWSGIVRNILGRKNEYTKKEKLSYKLNDMCEVIKLWLHTDMGLDNLEQIDHLTSNLRELVVTYKMK